MKKNVIIAKNLIKLAQELIQAGRGPSYTIVIDDSKRKQYDKEGKLVLSIKDDIAPYFPQDNGNVSYIHVKKYVKDVYNTIFTKISGNDCLVFKDEDSYNVCRAHYRDMVDRKTSQFDDPMGYNIHRGDSDQQIQSLITDFIKSIDMIRRQRYDALSREIGKTYEQCQDEVNDLMNQKKLSSEQGQELLKQMCDLQYYNEPRNPEYAEKPMDQLNSDKTGKFRKYIETIERAGGVLGVLRLFAQRFLRNLGTLQIHANGWSDEYQIKIGELTKQFEGYVRFGLSKNPSDLNNYKSVIATCKNNVALQTQKVVKQTENKINKYHFFITDNQHKIQTYIDVTSEQAQKLIAHGIKSEQQLERKKKKSSVNVNAGLIDNIKNTFDKIVDKAKNVFDKFYNYIENKSKNNETKQDMEFISNVYKNIDETIYTELSKVIDITEHRSF